MKTGRMEGRMEKWKNERMEEKTEGWKSGSLPSQPCAPEGPADFGRVLEHQMRINVYVDARLVPKSQPRYHFGRGWGTKCASTFMLMRVWSQKAS